MRSLVLVIVLVTCAVSAHNCVHDTEAHREMRRVLLAKNKPMEVLYSKFVEESMMPIRIAVDYSHINNISLVCTAVGQSRPNFGGQIVTCGENDVLTDIKRQLLVSVVMPAAVKMLQNALQVNQVVGPLPVPEDQCGAPYVTPPQHVSPGVPNADFVLYVSAGPTSGGTLAWATYCGQDAAHRPIVGKANFGPLYLVNSTAKEHRSLIRTAVHEILHALGVTETFWGPVGAMNTSMPGGRAAIIHANSRGKVVTIMNTPKVQLFARSYFNCPTAVGVEIEDGGGEGTSGSHFEKRSLDDEIMVGSASEGEYLSGVTLSYLEDTGLYTINWTAAEQMSFGKNAGCGFLNEGCNTTAGGKDKYFCFDTNTSNHYCSYDYKSYGACAATTYSSALPWYARYFASSPTTGGYDNLMDFCPTIAHPKSCLSGAIDVSTGQLYADNSRCFVVTAGLLKVGFEGSYIVRRDRGCFSARCDKVVSPPIVSFRVGDSTTWIQCSSAGQQINLNAYGYNGVATCPTDPTDFCTTLNSWTTASATSTTTASVTTTTSGASTTSSTSSTATAIATTTRAATTTTIAATLTVTTSAGVFTTSPVINVLVMVAVFYFYQT